MTRVIDRLVTLCVGVAIGVVIMLAFAKQPGESEDVNITLNPEMTEDAGSAAAVENQITQTEISPTQSEGEIEPESSVSPISIPDVYEDHIGPQQREVSFADIHHVFKNEPRDEPWAAAMESGINHYLANSGSGDWAVVEYLECRSRICEVAGYKTGSENHPSELVEEFMSSGIWHGEPGIHTSRFGDHRLKRFIIIISGYSNKEYRSVLSSL